MSSFITKFTQHRAKEIVQVKQTKANSNYRKAQIDHATAEAINQWKPLAKHLVKQTKKFLIDDPLRLGESYDNGTAVHMDLMDFVVHETTINNDWQRGIPEYVDAYEKAMTDYAEKHPLVKDFLDEEVLDHLSDPDRFSVFLAKAYIKELAKQDDFWLIHPDHKNIIEHGGYDGNISYYLYHSQTPDKMTVAIDYLKNRPQLYFSWEVLTPNIEQETNTYMKNHPIKHAEYLDGY